MSAASAATAPIERVTVPLRPRTPAGCCDLAVMFYGRTILPELRLYLAIAGPAVAAVYGFCRFVGTDLALAIVVGLVMSKALGVLTVAAASRTTFGLPFEKQRPDLLNRRSRRARLGELTRSILVAAAILAAVTLAIATFDDAYGAGRLTALGPQGAATIVSVIVVLLVVRAGLFLVERHAPGRSIWSGILAGICWRVLFAVPLAMLFFDETRGPGIAVALLWLPVAALIALSRSFRTEQRTLSEIDPALHPSEARRALVVSEIIGPAFFVATAAACLWLVVLLGVEFSLTVIGLPGPITGPMADYMNLDFFEPDLALSALGRSPLFAATALAAWLFAYQIGRLAWFFVYLDARVRRDCWDMELLLAREAKRLAGQDEQIVNR